MTTLREGPQEDRRGERGFTLVEVMIALVIFAVGLLAVVGMQFSSVFLNKQSKDISDAAIVASATVEALMQMPFGDAALNDTDGDGTGGLDHDTVLTADHAAVQDNYSIFTNIFDQDLNADATIDFKQINVIVTWTKVPSGRPGRLSYTFARGRDVD